MGAVLSLQPKENRKSSITNRKWHDGPHVIAEYDGNNNLLRKYIYGPGIDQPVCMIEVADANAVYYYHFDALGSVVALSDAAGDTVQTYEYSVYGEVAVEDANHPNPYMFAGVRYDIEIGLYYNRARYYNPFAGRFLQTDPIGYGDGLNWYAYCGNNPSNYTDPSGLYKVSVKIPLQTIWHRSSMDASVKGKRITTEDDPQHKSDVQGFLGESNLSTKFPKAKLDSVRYSGTSKEGTYYVVFDVPDDDPEYENWDMDTDWEGDVPVLVVKTGPRGSVKRETRILDWRLVGMLNDPDYKGSDVAEHVVLGIVAEGVSIASWAGAHALKVGQYSTKLVTITRTIGFGAQAFVVVEAYTIILAPRHNVPGFAEWSDYYDFVNSFDGGLDSLNGRYDDYKRQHNL